MPITKVESEDILDRLTEVFRTVGYEGATLSKLSEATGLQRASLYHRFPGGKKEMAETVLLRCGSQFQEQILNPLKGEGTPEERLQRMARNLSQYYQKGNAACLLDTLSVGEGQDIFSQHIQESFALWIETLAKVVQEGTDLTKARSKQIAEDQVMKIQGALVLARGTGVTKPFQRVLQGLPEILKTK